MTPIFYIKKGDLSFADKVILSDIELYVSPGDKICLVGKNGCGKSSLMKIISGEYELDSNEPFRDPAITIGYLKQDMKLDFAGTIYDFVLSGLKDPESNKYNADIILSQLEIDGSLVVKNCSGGQIRRVHLAKSLINQPDILLLDEPTNHLDIRAIEWLESYIKSYKGAVVCISHDRRFQESVTNKVWWLDRGQLRKSDRGFKHYDQWREEIIETEEAALRKMNRKLEAEKDWLHGGVTARRKRNQKRLANLYHLRSELKAQQSHLHQAKARVQMDMMTEAKKTKFIIEAEKVSFGFERRVIARSAERDAAIQEDNTSGSPRSLDSLAMTGQYLFKDFSIQVKKGEKIGVIGPNGSGKSTLIKLFTKELTPISGKIKHGTNIEISYFDQYRSDLNPSYSLKQTLCPGGGDQVFLKDKTMHIAAYLKKFMFDPKTLDNKVSTLSGGEANRLLLAKALINPGNLFILDEPTNDLDMDSLDMLLEMLADYTGTLIIVSHDRDFLERLVTRSLVFANNKIIDLYGGYEDYLKYYEDNNSTMGLDKKKKQNTNTQESQAVQNPSKKLSYKYARLLETLPSEINDLELKIKNIEELLSDSDLYSKNNQKFNSLSTDLDKSKLDLDKKLEQWMEIEQMKEEL